MHARFTLCFCFALAAAAAEPTYPRGLAFGVTADGSRHVPVPLESTEVVLDVKPGLIEAQVTQTFVNRADVALEATYLYPLPDRATVTDFELRYPNHTVRSEVREKAAAQAAYDAAKATGKKTALLEQRDPTLFSTAVANFLPGERVEVVLRFVQPLPLTAEAIEVRFPMVTSERYFPPDFVSGGVGDAKGNPSRRPPDLVAEHHVYAFDIQVAGLPVKRFGSSHPIRTQSLGSAPERYSVALEQNITIPDRDFVLRMELRPGVALQPTVVAQHTATGDYGLVTFFPPRRRPESVVRPPRDVLFLIDRSGSMAGARLDSAKLGLEGCLDALEPQDRFQMVAFDDSYAFYRVEWTPAEPEEIATAHRYVRKLEIRGGTQLQPALSAALDVFERGDRQQILILLTDGDVGNGSALLNLVERKIGQIRLFALGIGPEPNATLLRQVAELGRGQARFIADDAGVARELGDLFATLDAPVLTEPRVKLLDAQGQEIEHTTFPERLPDVFYGRPVQMVYRSTKGAPAAIAIEAVENRQPVARRLALEATTLRGDALEKEFGRRLFDDTGAMLRRATTDDERALVRKEMLATALQFQLVTELTSRVAVDDRVVRDPNAPLATEPVAQYVPADQMAGEVVALTPFTVASTVEQGGYLSGSRFRRTTGVVSSIRMGLGLGRSLLEEFAATGPEDALPFLADAQSNPPTARPGQDAALLDDLPLTTLVDPAMLDRIELQPNGLARIELLQQHAPRTPATTLTARVGSDDFAAVSLKTAFRPAGTEGVTIFGILSAENFAGHQFGALLEGEKTFGDSRMRLSAQGRGLNGYGETRLLRGAVEHRFTGGLVLEMAAAWHELNRDDPEQFRLGAGGTQEGLGFVNLDLLTAETRRLEEAVAQVKLAHNWRRDELAQTWSARLRWHRQESDWIVPLGWASPTRRDTRELELEHRLALGDRLHVETHLGLARESTPRTTEPLRTAWTGDFAVDRRLTEGLSLFGNWSREAAQPWVATGRWRSVGTDRQAVAPELEVRRGGQLGAKLETWGKRLTVTVGAFHETVSGLEYRDWQWESVHPGLRPTVLGTELRQGQSTSVAPEFARAGWTSLVAFNPSRAFTSAISWSVDGKNDGPYRGGNRRGSALARYEFRSGGLRGFAVGGALHYRNALEFDDGYALRGGWRGDVMLGYRLTHDGRGDTWFQVNAADVGDGGWQLTRFAPAHGRRIWLTVTQSF